MCSSMRAISSILADPIKTILLLPLAATNGFGIIHNPVVHEGISKVMLIGISRHSKYFSFKAIAVVDEIAAAEGT